VTLRIDPDAASSPSPRVGFAHPAVTIAANYPRDQRRWASLEEIARQISTTRFKTTWFNPAGSGLPSARTTKPRLGLLWLYQGADAERERCDRGTHSSDSARLPKPYAYAYLAFVHLYDWHPSPAEAALKSALNPNLPPEIQALRSVAALMQETRVTSAGSTRAGKDKGDK